MKTLFNCSYFRTYFCSFLLIIVLISCDRDAVVQNDFPPNPPAPPVNPIEEDVEEGGADSTIITFLHISDTHKSTISILPMVDLLNDCDCDFGIITGDLMVNESMMDILLDSKKPIFIIPGNHDGYDAPNGQLVFRTQVLDKLQSHEIVNFGNEGANYYYVDIEKNGKVTRIIGLDQYEVDRVGRGRSNDVVMSQHQVDWFMKLLQESYDINGIIVLIHCGFGNHDYGRRNIENRNAFISTLAYDQESYQFYGSAYPLMIPEIVNAYLTGINIEGKEYSSGYEGVNIKVNTSFVGEHHNFVGYFGGHVHWDFCEYLPDYPMQLQILMCYCGTGNGKYNLDCNDIIKTESGDDSWNINRNVLDYCNKTLNIYRLGAHNLITGGTRDSIQFKINK